MTIKGTRRAALIILASCAASAAHAQTSRPQNGEFVMLDRPAVFDINPEAVRLTADRLRQFGEGRAPEGLPEPQPGLLELADSL